MGLRILGFFLFCAFVGGVTFSANAQQEGSDCKNAAQQAKSACDGLAQAVNSADNMGSGAAGNALAGQNTINPGAGAQAGTCSPQSSRAANLANDCQKAQDSCQDRCQDDQQQLQSKCSQPIPPGYCPSQQGLLQQGTKVCSSLVNEISQATQALGGAANCTDQSNNTKSASNGMPMPIPSSGGSGGNSSSPQQPAAVASACDSTTGTNCLTGASATTASAGATDSGNQVAYVPPKAANMQSASAAPSLNLGTTAGASPIGAAASGGAGAVGGGSGSWGNNMGTASANGDTSKDSKGKASVTEGSVSGMAPDNQYGDAAGGGGMDTSSADSASSLAAYLPGGKNDPTKRKPATAAMNTASAHPDIVSQNESLFNVITKRMHLMCTMKEFIGCN